MYTCTNMLWFCMTGKKSGQKAYLVHFHCPELWLQNALICIILVYFRISVGDWRQLDTQFLLFFFQFCFGHFPWCDYWITGITGESAIHCNYKIMCNSHSVFLSFTTVCEVFVTQWTSTWRWPVLGVYHHELGCYANSFSCCVHS